MVAGRSAKRATTRRAGSGTSESAALSLNCSDERTTGSAGAAGSGRRLFSTTSTGRKIRIRGVLCSNCNRGIGLLGDHIEGITHALNYLNRYEARKASSSA